MKHIPSWRGSAVLSCILFCLLAQTSLAVTRGDVNNDGKVNVLDVTTVLKSIVGLSTLTPDQQQASDVSPMPGTAGRAVGDGELNVSDAITMLQFIVGLVASLDPSSTLVPSRAATLKGRVLTREGAPLPDVLVSIYGHPEYPGIPTDANGDFNLPVNGGGWLTVNYQKTGFLSAQRKVQLPWKTDAVMPDVALVALDSNVTRVDLSGGASVQAARGNPVTDADGARRATLIFPSGTTASLVKPDGSTLPASSLSIRATEYTVGLNGPKAMPAELPLASGYTYAVELSADEAIQAGAEVRFSQPIYSYTENFLDFPVGGKVPAASYDRVRGAWVPQDDGRVVKILSVEGGAAALDTDGDGNADGEETLAALKITPEERGRLAELYVPGQTLWRVAIMHFSPYDYNWPYGCSDFDNDGVPECLPPLVPSPKNRRKENPCETQGCIVEAENQTLGERIEITGTPYSLNYRSDRMAGKTDTNSLAIPLSGSSLKYPVKRIDLEITVGGETFHQNFPGVTNQDYVFTWDGKTPSGKVLTGKQPVKVRLGYAYPAVYLTPSAFARSFGALGGIPLRRSRENVEISLWSVWESTITLESPDARKIGLGGWTLNQHHSYNPATQILWLGNGDAIPAHPVGANVITTIAGRSPTNATGIGDGGPANQAMISVPADVAVAPDGSYYFSDEGYNRVRRVDLNGIITTVAGNGVKDPGKQGGFSGDGGPATAAQLNGPRGIALGPDGSIYIADRSNQRIRKVDPSGIITTFAGNGVDSPGHVGGFSGDGGPATGAQLYLPSWVALSTDGSLYISDHFNGRVRRVAPDGIITTVAGGGDPPGGVGDGLEATKASFDNVAGIAIGPDGLLYIAEYGNRVRRVGADGIISTVAGDGNDCAVDYFACGDGGLATKAQIRHPQNIAFGPDGALYITGGGSNRMRRVGTDGIISTFAGNGKGCLDQSECGDGGPAIRAQFSILGGFTFGPDGSLYLTDALRNHPIRKITLTGESSGLDEMLIPSRNGDEIYAFDSAGRHLRTVDALMGTPRYLFTYEGEFLKSITDRDGNVTSLERDPSGVPTGILSPSGQRTALGLNADGYIEKVTNPAGEVDQLGYGAGGLLTSFTNAKGIAEHYAYDPAGRLIRDEDAVGGFQTLVRTEAGAKSIVSQETALGRKKLLESEAVANAGSQSEVTFPTGLQTLTVKNNLGDQTTTYPDGTVKRVVTGSDPRFGSDVPFASETKITTPGGLVSTQTFNRTVTLQNQDLLSLLTQTDTLAINNRRYTITYDAVKHLLTSASPENRQSVVTLNAQGRIGVAQVGTLAPLAMTYDEKGRPLTFTQGTGEEARATTLRYNAEGYLGGITDALGRDRSFTYDAAGRIQVQTLPDNGIVSYTFDPVARLTSLAPPGRTPHAFNYTDVNLLSAYLPPGGESTQYAYNLDGQIQKATRPDGSALDFSYDAGGRVSAVQMPNGTLASTYDPATGNVATLTAPGGTVLTYQFDGSLLKRAAWTGPVAGTVERGYDNNFFVTSRTVNALNSVAFQYNRDGLMTRAGQLSLTHDPKNGFITDTALASLTTKQEYNSFAEPVKSSLSRNGAALFAVEYTRDKAGRITTLVVTTGGATETTTYGYDSAGRLLEIQKNGTPWAAYGYDPNGNRISLTAAGATTVGTYDSQDRLTGYGGADYTYAPGGELQKKTLGALVTSYQYDLLGSLLSVILPDGKLVEYLVDGQGRRVGKKVNGALVQGFLYQDGIRPIVELDGAGKVVSRFVYGSGGVAPDYMIKNSINYRIVTDHVGSPRLVVNSSTGEIVQRIDYDAFGKILADTNPGFQPFGFGGGLADADTGLVRFGERDYDPETGRWTARDPLYFDGGQENLYVYAGNDPVNRVDPLGRASVEGSFYSGIGGGITVSYTEGEGLSAGYELGVGKGVGFEIDPDGKPYQGDSNLTMFGEGEGRFGPVRGSLRLESQELEPCPGEFGPATLKPKFCVAMFCAGDDGVTVRGDQSEGIKEFFGKETGYGFEGKAGAKVIFNIFGPGE